ncbi:MAG TPA: alpha/beta hydrolase, partial [Stenotrophomonas sp.]|nr:alpha/beta hydrolase [Stenotrophomonas sp.]
MTDRIPLLLLPGLLNDAELWRAQLADLADIADCTVGDQTRGETLQAVAEDVLAQAPERFALAGFS